MTRYVRINTTIEASTADNYIVADLSTGDVVAECGYSNVVAAKVRDALEAFDGESAGGS